MPRGTTIQQQVVIHPAPFVLFVECKQNARIILTRVCGFNKQGDTII